MSTFDESLARGKIAESKVARWLRLRGWTIIPVYELETSTGKGPQVYTPSDQLIAPDLLAWKQNNWRFIEVKDKSVFTRYRRPNRYGVRGAWQTGIDLRHYEQYLLVGEHFDFEIWLMFLHEKNQPSQIDLAYPACPSVCPTGLFANKLGILKDCVDHSDSRWARGMVYWNKHSLKEICRLEELNSTARETIFDHVPLRGIQDKSLFLE